MAKWGVNRVCLVKSVSEWEDRRWQHCSVHQHMSQHILSDLLTDQIRCLSECCEVSQWETAGHKAMTSNSSSRSDSSSQMGRLLACTRCPQKNKKKTLLNSVDLCSVSSSLFCFTEMLKKSLHCITYLVNPHVMGLWSMLLLQVGAIWIRVSSPAAQQIVESLSSAPLWHLKVMSSQKPCEAKSVPYKMGFMVEQFSVIGFLYKQGSRLESDLRQNKRWMMSEGLQWRARLLRVTWGWHGQSDSVSPSGGQMIKSILWPSGEKHLSSKC